jgi:hypothetical protein
LVEYRRHTSRRDVIKQGALAGIPFLIAGWNAFRVAEGLATGAVMSLAKRSHNFVDFEADPGWFVFNVCLRTFGILFFGAIGVVLWRQFRRDVRL